MTTIGNFYAIREKGTHRYLPALANARGHTHSSPTAGPQPRLFNKRRAAQLALTAWLKGRAKPITGTEYGDFGEHYEVQEGVEYTPEPGRDADKMEIVELILVEAP